MNAIDGMTPGRKGGPVVEVTSLKSHKLWAEGYARPGTFRRTLEREIDALAELRAGKVGKVRVNTGPDTRRTLDIEVPPNTLGEATVPDYTDVGPALRAQWRTEAAEALVYARSKGVDLRFVSSA